jgi:hypothetical protein
VNPVETDHGAMTHIFEPALQETVCGIKRHRVTSQAIQTVPGMICGICRSAIRTKRFIARRDHARGYLERRKRA